MTQQEMNSDVLVRLSHMSLWVLLATIVYVGSAMLLILLGGPELVNMARWALILLPVANVIAIGALHSKGGKASCANSPQMRAVMDDELRQQALAKAYRNGFFTTLVATVLVAPVVSIAGVEKGPAVMMVAVITLGVSSMLASVLYHDR